MLGFIICVFSLIVSFGLVSIDYWAEKKDNIKKEVDDKEGFNWKEIANFSIKAIEGIQQDFPISFPTQVHF